MIDEQQKQLEYIDEIKNIIDNDYYNHTPTCCVVTFGCQMNAKDSEKLLGILVECGYRSIDDEDKADIVIFNTCTVRENANQRLYGRIGQLKKSYQVNNKKIIALCGCMMQEKDEVELIQSKYPYIKLIFGTHNVYKFAELLYKTLSTNNRVVEILDKTDSIVENLPTKRKYPFKCGINIMFGCNNFCSYCIVPYVRGRERSRDADDIFNEIKEVVSDGVVEVMLLGQNVNSYGLDNNNISFDELLNKICQIDGLKRVRFMTSHPKDLSDELIEVIKNNKKICRHIHLPVQSGSNRILKLMNRKYTREHYIDLIKKIKNNIEDVSITTDIIVGFPTETEEDFEDTLSLIKEVEFDSAFTFKYSKRTGTKAAEMDGQVDDEVVSKRFDRLLDLIKDISNKNNDRFINKIYDCLVEDIDYDKKLLVGRMSNNLLVYFSGSFDLLGSIVNVKISNNNGFYFDGELVD